MEALILAKKATARISGSWVKDQCKSFVQSASTISASYGFSTAYERAEGSNAAAETTDSQTKRDRGYGRNEAADDGTARGGMGHVAEGVKRMTQAAETVGYSATEAVDGAWKMAQEASRNVRDAVSSVGEEGGERIREDGVVEEIKDVKQPVDTQKYRGVEELQKGGGGL